MEAAEVIDVSPSLRLHKYKSRYFADYVHVVQIQIQKWSGSLSPFSRLSPIEPFLSLYSFFNSFQFSFEDAETPLVLLMPWMTCTEKAVKRYRQLYARRGYNVLTLFPKSSYYYWPSSAKVIAREIIHILLTHTDVAASPIIVHAFSIGSVVYSILLSQMLAENSKEIGELRDRIVGHVFDSMIIEGPWDRVKGVAHILSSRWLMQQLIFSVAHVYYLLTYKYTQRVMNEAKEAMYKNPFQTPLLVFYSAVDPMCKTKTMEDFVRCWADRTGQLAHLKAWDDAPHAGGLQKYPEEYTKTLFKYMDSLELKGAQNHPSKL